MASGLSGTSGAEGGSAFSHKGLSFIQQTVAVAGAGIPRWRKHSLRRPSIVKRAAEPEGTTGETAPETRGH